jgi:hypothetical protein
MVNRAEVSDGWHNRIEELNVPERLAQLPWIAGKADDAFDEISRLVFGEFEDDDVPASNRAEPIDELVDQEVIANSQRRLHGARRDHEGLKDERANRQSQQDGNDQRFCVLSEERPVRPPQFRERIEKGSEVVFEAAHTEYEEWGHEGAWRFDPVSNTTLTVSGTRARVTSRPAVSDSPRSQQRVLIS